MVVDMFAAINYIPLGQSIYWEKSKSGYEDQNRTWNRTPSTLHLPNAMVRVFLGHFKKGIRSAESKGTRFDIFDVQSTQMQMKTSVGVSHATTFYMTVQSDRYIMKQ